MKNPKISLTQYFPSLIDLAKAKKEGYPCLDIQQYFTANLGIFQAFIDYQDNEYVIKYRGFIHGSYISKWEVYSHSPYQKYIIQSFKDLVLDFLDPNPLLEVQNVLLSQV